MFRVLIQGLGSASQALAFLAQGYRGFRDLRE